MLETGGRVPAPGSSTRDRPQSAVTSSVQAQPPAGARLPCRRGGCSRGITAHPRQLCGASSRRQPVHVEVSGTETQRLGQKSLIFKSLNTTEGATSGFK